MNNLKGDSELRIIGLTGGSGAGKSVASRLLLNRGGRLIDCDKVYAELVCAPSACTAALSRAFGESILQKNGALDRAKLASVVFSDGGKAKLALLNSTVHPFVVDEVKSIIDTYSSIGVPYVIIDAPQLFEANAHTLCDCTVFVTADEEKRIARICERDGIDRERAIMRIRSQYPDEYFLERCTYVLVNDSGEEELALRCEELLDVLGIKKV